MAAMTYAEAKERLLGLDAHFVTLVPDTGIVATDVGKIGTISDNGEWGLGADAGVPFGVLAVFETDAVGVQDRGYVEIDFEHNATAANEVVVGSWVELDGAGKGALAAAATGVRAVAVDSTNHKAIVRIA